MARILWQTRSSTLCEAFNHGELKEGVTGGDSYEYAAAEVIAKNNHCSMDPIATMQSNESVFSYWRKMKKSQPRADLLIQQPYPAIFSNTKGAAKRVAMIHHVSDIPKNRNLSTYKYRFMNWLFERAIPELDQVITVSQYWKTYLQNLGCSNVKIIYNSFAVENYRYDAADALNFRKEHNFSPNIPLIYIGNASAEKGVYEVYEALKNTKYQLIMTGGSNKAKDLPVAFFSLAHSDYLRMLNACDVVVTYSIMQEGWNRVAHEAMLSCTAVVGSGTGGMRELLEDGGQIVVQDKNEIESGVRQALERSDELGATGRKYAERFDLEYFSREWNSVVEQLID